MLVTESPSPRSVTSSTVCPATSYTRMRQAEVALEHTDLKPRQPWYS